MLKVLLGVEQLFAGGENERLPAFDARQCFVPVLHVISLGGMLLSLAPHFLTRSFPRESLLHPFFFTRL